jgi:iron complex transport system permease protein
MKQVGLVSVGFVFVLFAALHLFWGDHGMSATEVMRALAGDSHSELHRAIVWDIRVPRLLTAMAAGGMLAWLGMVMQTWFHNPLAGPGVLGITSGGSLGVALSVLLGWGLPSWLPASVGCLVALGLVGWAMKRFASPVTTLVFGLMLSYAVGAAVTILEASASSDALQSFVFWGMGTLGKSSLWQSWTLLGLMLVMAIWLSRRAPWLDAWSLGDQLATTMGVPAPQFRREMLLLAGIAVGWVTSICGPLAFLGLATPHVYRFFHRARSHRDMMWGVLAWGMLLAMGADLIVRGAEATELVMRLPLNAVLAMIGAPVVVAVLWKRTVDWS